MAKYKEVYEKALQMFDNNVDESVETAKKNLRWAH
jgi:hypothetical protein